MIFTAPKQIGATLLTKSENMRQYLIQRSWFRRLFSNKTYILTECSAECSAEGERWKYLADFTLGEKILRVEGKFNIQTWCKCGNELVHSKSFLGEREIKKTEITVYDYKCSCCGRLQYRRPDIGAGLYACNRYGRVK